MDRNENIAWSMAIKEDSFHSELSERCSDMTEEMFGVITTVSAELVWRCNQPSQVSQTATSKRRSQSFCLSVFLPPASLSWQHLWASVTHSCQSIIWMATLFLSATKERERERDREGDREGEREGGGMSCWWVWLSIFTAVSEVFQVFQSCGPLASNADAWVEVWAAFVEYIRATCSLRCSGCEKVVLTKSTQSSLPWTNKHVWGGGWG